MKCSCGGNAELRYNAGNNGVAYQCHECNEVLSGWLPHSQLLAVNVLDLPKWDRTPKNPGQGVLL